MSIQSFQFERHNTLQLVRPQKPWGCGNLTCKTLVSVIFQLQGGLACQLLFELRRINAW
jgi:hypothetical protein